jgi:hypothetical protein
LDLAAHVLVPDCIFTGLTWIVATVDKRSPRALDAQGEERVQAEPFEAATFSVHGLLGGDDED